MDRPYDRLDGVIWYDGKLVAGARRTCMCSRMDCIMRAPYSRASAPMGAIFKCSQHSERLKRSAQLLDFEIPFSAAEIDAAKRLVLEKTGSRTPISGRSRGAAPSRWGSRPRTIRFTSRSRPGSGRGYF